MRIVDKERALTRTATNFTELWIVGTDDEVITLTGVLRRAGTLVYQSAPHPMGGADHRTRIYLRLYLPNP